MIDRSIRNHSDLPLTAAVTQTTADATRSFLGGLVALTFVMNTVGRGVAETFAVFLLPVEAAFGLDRAAISATYSIYMVSYAVAAPLVGQLIDRMGARACYALGLVSIGVGNLIAAQAQSIGVYYFGFGVLSGLGAAALGMVAASSLLSRWFTTRIATMSAVPYAAVGAGMLIFPPLTQYLLLSYNWRNVQAWLGLSALALLPLLIMLPLSRYSAGADAWRQIRTQQTSTAGGVTAPRWSLTQALRSSAFWMLFVAYFATSVAAYSVMPHLVAFLVERGFAKQTAAWAFGATGVLSLAGIFAMGWLSDRIGRLPAVTLSYGLTIAGILALLAIAYEPSIAFLYVFLASFGLMQGARGPILVALVAKLFAGGSIGAIFGCLSMALGLGAGVGSLASGWLHAVTGSYASSFAMAAIASVLGLATFWLAPSLRHERASLPHVA